MPRLENSPCQPSSKMGTFFELGKAKVAKGEGWAPPFISCAQDTLTPTAPTAIRLRETFPSIRTDRSEQTVQTHIRLQGGA